ncbi:MAG: hypothetical protein SFU56_04010 [Capsulimonadales bacterium]|nr:hypothetical protein [Capsulimonadales bacterium]
MQQPTTEQQFPFAQQLPPEQQDEAAFVRAAGLRPLAAVVEALPVVTTA